MIRSGSPPRRGGREQALAYVELHIEQGPVLEAEGLPLGLVTSIAGASRYTITLTGEAGHAGTVPMALRRDALAAAAEAVLLVERRCAEGLRLVGTVGHIAVIPGAVNVIPGRPSSASTCAPPRTRIASKPPPISCAASRTSASAAA